MKAINSRQGLLAELPPAPPDKTGWPWTEESKSLPPKMPGGNPWPRISIVTPSYNQGQFIEETIRSILLQNYPDIECIIIDGGSNDNTLEIIRKYEKWIAYWVSEKDRGQSHALNKGLRLSTGLLIGWQNSDDYYGMDSFAQCALIALQNPDADVYHGTSFFMDERGTCHVTLKKDKFSIEENPDLLTRFQFSNQSMFFNRRIFDEGYFIDERYNHAMDGEFMTRLIIAGYKFQFVPEMTGICRTHNEAKTAKRPYLGIIENVDICINVLKSAGISPTIRRWALESLREALPALYYSFRMNEFRTGLYSLIRFGGFRVLDIKFVVRYLLSFLGVTFAKSLYGLIAYCKRIVNFLTVRVEHARYRWTSRKEKFTKIYQNEGFGGIDVPLSGSGSTLVQTRCIREKIPSLLRKIRATSIIDAPCGDYAWMMEIDLGNISYVGVDIVQSVIQDNMEKFSSDKRKFCEMDIVVDILPTADLILCRDCFVHLSNKDIMRAVKNFKNSNSKYLLTTTFTQLSKNRNLVSGRGWRPVNLMLPPFNFPPPIEIINEGCSEGSGLYSDKCLGLWNLDTL